jgi:hypothetical protein
MNKPAASTGSVILDEIAEVIGEEAALRLARAFGGIELYVPAKVGHNHPITVAIGAEAAATLVEHYHGTEISIARTGERHHRVRALASTGRLTKKAIARETGYTERWVYKLLSDDEEGEQPDLFSLK